MKSRGDVWARGAMGPLVKKKKREKKRSDSAKDWAIPLDIWANKEHGSEELHVPKRICCLFIT